MQVRVLVQTTVGGQLQDIFRHRIASKIFDDVRSVCSDFLNDALIEQYKTAERVLNWELSKPKTLNEPVLFIARDSATTLLRTERRKILAEPYLEALEEKLGRQFTGAQREEKMAKMSESEFEKETFGPELRALAVCLLRLSFVTSLTSPAGNQSILRSGIQSFCGYHLHARPF